MNVEGEQNASASAPASPTTASTAAGQQAPQITSFFQLERTSPTQATPATSLPAAAADLPAAAAGTNMTAPASSHQQWLDSTNKECFGIPPQARPVGVRRLLHPLVYHTPSFITPPNTPCGCSDVLSHPLVYHTPTFITPPNDLWVVGRAITPLGLSHPLWAAATSTLSPGLHKIPHPPQGTTPGDNTFKRLNVSPGVCYLVWFTVCACLTGGQATSLFITSGLSSRMQTTTPEEQYKSPHTSGQ